MTSKPLETLPLPREAAEALRKQGLDTVEGLLAWPLSQVVRVDELIGLTEEEWQALLKRIKARVPKSPWVWRETDLSLLRLGLSTRPRNCLLRGGITDLDRLSQCTLAELIGLRHLGIRSLIEVLTRLRTYLDTGELSDVPIPVLPLRSKDRDRENPATNNPAEPPERKSKNQEDSLAGRVYGWLEALAERDQEVLRCRYGLEDGQPQTLEQIGERLDLSRERVRQIERRATEHLKRSWRRRKVQPLVRHLQEAIDRRGGVAAEDLLAESLADVMEAGPIHLPGVARLLLATHPEFAEVKRFQAWGLSALPLELIPEIHQQVILMLAAEHVPLSEEELLNRFKATPWHQNRAHPLSDEFILACTRLSEKVVCREDGGYGLEKWERQYQDDIILALRRLGRPAHYTEITAVVNATLPPDRSISPQGVHLRLWQYPNLFVWVGRRGTYGLKEWGLERPPSYEEALAQILEEAGQPLTLPQILPQLSSLRPYYDANSVEITLGTNGRFRTFSGGAYGLAEW